MLKLREARRWGNRKRGECSEYTEWQILDGNKIIWRGEAFGPRSVADAKFAELTASKS